MSLVRQNETPTFGDWARDDHATFPSKKRTEKTKRVARQHASTPARLTPTDKQKKAAVA
jgi:hypothetical protein